MFLISTLQRARGYVCTVGGWFIWLELIVMDCVFKKLTCLRLAITVLLR